MNSCQYIKICKNHKLQLFKCLVFQKLGKSFHSVYWNQTEKPDNTGGRATQLGCTELCWDQGSCLCCPTRAVSPPLSAMRSSSVTPPWTPASSSTKVDTGGSSWYAPPAVAIPWLSSPSTPRSWARWVHGGWVPWQEAYQASGWVYRWGEVSNQVTQTARFSFLTLDRRHWLHRKHCLRSSSRVDLEQSVPWLHFISKRGTCLDTGKEWKQSHLLFSPSSLIKFQFYQLRESLKRMTNVWMLLADVVLRWPHLLFFHTWNIWIHYGSTSWELWAWETKEKKPTVTFPRQ